MSQSIRVGRQIGNTHVGNDEVACGSFYKTVICHGDGEYLHPGTGRMTSTGARASISSKPVQSITNTALPEGWADGGMLILISVP